MWSFRGFTGTGNVDKLIGSIKGCTVILVGNAEGVFGEFKEAVCCMLRSRGEEAMQQNPPVIFAVNDVGMFLPHVDHWISIHADKFPAWLSVRQVYSRNLAKIHSVDYGAGVNYAWLGIRPMFILSGYLAMQIAYIMGAGKIVLCGCPGSPARCFFEIQPREFGYGNGYSLVDPHVKDQLVAEMERLPELKATVCSMSGWTKDYFGFFDSKQLDS